MDNSKQNTPKSQSQTERSYSNQDHKNLPSDHDYEDTNRNRKGVRNNSAQTPGPHSHETEKPSLEEESSDDYETGKRSAGTYDEDDYDSNYGNSNDYRDQTFDNHLSGGFKQSYDKQDHIPDQDQYGRSYKKSNNDYDNHIEDEVIIDRRESPQDKE